MFRDRSSKMKEVEPASVVVVVLLVDTHTDINLVINQRRQTTKIRTSEFSPRVREATNVDVFTLSTEFTVQM
ncbi:hypothetical protein QR98_0077120 [Sarcoptes scabiei]|uniref:Uncharacterized protein n=1 Tax=Sarcoptes scabiei TaxID=52283 RepID=A0A132AE98_SARSC|nr:hypothetical protein QR98_0077120 [Sarcoptes scabiei]